MTRDSILALFAAIGTAALYLLAVEAALLLPFNPSPVWQRLDAPEIIALAGGVLTAAGFAALFIQLRAADRAAQDAAAIATLRFDELHADFNSKEMREARYIAWEYLKWIQHKPDKLRLFANWWVFDGNSAPTPSQGEIGVLKSAVISPHTVENYTDSVSIIIAFFVRIENRFSAYHSIDKIDPILLHTSVGPFFWTSWSDGILAIVNACDSAFLSAWDAAQSSQANTIALRFKVPYFSAALRNLDARFTAQPPPLPTSIAVRRVAHAAEPQDGAARQAPPNGRTVAFTQSESARTPASPA